MAVKLPLLWEAQLTKQIRPGGKIVDDLRDDMEQANHATHRVMAANVRAPLAQGGYGRSRVADETGTASFTVRGECSIRNRRANLRCEFSVYARDIDARLKVDGTTVATISPGTSMGWTTSSIVTLNGLTPGGNDDMLVEFEVIATGANPEWVRWVLSESEYTSSGDLPDGGDGTEFQKVDTDAFGPDRPFDGWTLGTLRRNANEALRFRTRGTGMAWPLNEPYLVSSVFPRCEGPYIYNAQPWEEELEALIRIRALNFNVFISVFSEHELDDLGYIIAPTSGRRQSLAAGTTATKHFDGIRLRTNPGATTPNKIWIYFTCASNPTKDSSLTVSVIHSTGTRDVTFTTHTTTIGGQDTAPGWMLSIPNEESWRTSTEKGFTEQDAPVTFFDIAADVEDATETVAVLSPNPNHPQHQYPSTSGGVDMDLHEVGTIEFRSVWFNGLADGLQLVAGEFWNAAGVDALPSATDFEHRLLGRLNEAAVFGTPQIGMSSLGEQWMRDSFVSTDTIYSRGRYTFRAWETGGGDNYRRVAEWAVGTDPVSASMSEHRLDTAGIRAGFEFLIVGTRNSGVHVANLNARLVVDGVAGPVQSIQARVRNVFDGTMSRSQWDAAQAAVIVGNDDVAGEQFQHAYVHQVSFLDDVAGGRYPWLTSPILTGPLPTSYPAFVDIELSFKGGDYGGDTIGWAVVTGAWAEYAPRTGVAVDEPPDTANLVYDLDARYLDHLGDGDAVQSWVSRHTANEAIQTTPANAPVYDEDGGPSFGPSVNFDSTDWLDGGAGSPIPATGAFTFYALVKGDGASTTKTIFAQYLDSGTGRLSIETHSADGDIKTFMTNPTLTLDPNKGSDTDWHVVILARTGDSMGMGVDVATDDASGTYTSGSVLQTGVTIGSRTSSSTDYNGAQGFHWGGRMVGVWIYDAYHNSTARTAFLDWATATHGWT